MFIMFYQVLYKLYTIDISKGDLISINENQISYVCKNDGKGRVICRYCVYKKSCSFLYIEYTE